METETKNQKNDVAPALLERVRKLFEEEVRNSKRIKLVKQRYNDKTITYADVEIYALELGQILSRAYQQVLTKDELPDGRMYWNIAERVVGSTLQHNFDLVEKLGKAVIKMMNEEVGIGINAVSADWR